MKRIFFILSVFLYSQAYATKARVQALAHSAHLIDEQYIFSNVLYANTLENFIALESGLSNTSSSTTTNSNAEGMLGYKLNENKTLILALGHQDHILLSVRQFANSFGLNYTMPQNPIHLFLGLKTDDINYSIGALYSQFKNKLNSESESSAGISLGVEVGAWQYYGTYVVNNDVELTIGDKFEGNGAWSLNAYYTGDSVHGFLTLNKSFVKSYSSGIEAESHDIQTIYLGLLDTQSKDGYDSFFGAQLVSTAVNCHLNSSVQCDQKYTSTILPVWFGYEMQATSWFVLRGSITQTVLLNQSKDELGYPARALDFSTGGLSEFSAGTNTTQVAAGVGLSFENLTIDGTLTVGSSQVINTSNLMGQLGLKYNY